MKTKFNEKREDLKKQKNFPLTSHKSNEIVKLRNLINININYYRDKNICINQVFPYEIRKRVTFLR